MTTAVELEAIARSIAPVADTTGACAWVDHQPGSKLPNGDPTGIGGRTTYRAAFIVGGRRTVPVGPAFDRGRDAIRLVRLLTGERPAPRPAPVIPAGPPVEQGNTEPDQEPTGAPAPGPDRHLADGPTSAHCVECGSPLPPGGRSHRRTCSPACRVAASRRRAAERRRADADGGPAAVTLSDASTEADPDPLPRVALGNGVRSSARPGLLRSAHPAAAPGGQRGEDLTLGLSG